MILDIALISALAFGAFIADRKIKARIERRKILNRLMAVASEDFHSAARSMLKTPEEIPDSVLDVLSTMSRTGFAKGSEKQFLHALRSMRKTPAPSTTVANGYKEMRPEMQALFRKSAAAWFNIMTHKSGRYHDKIAIEALKAEADRIEPHKQAISTASGMVAAPC